MMRHLCPWATKPTTSTIRQLSSPLSPARHHPHKPLNIPQRQHHHHHHRPYSNFAPQQPITYRIPPPPHRSRWSRLCDMAIGSFLTISAYLALQHYELRRYQRALMEAEREVREVLELHDHFAGLIAEARERGDSDDVLRELLFEQQRLVNAKMSQRGGGDGDLEVDIEEGPLLGFPAGHELAGRERVRVRDTLVFFERPDGDGEEYDDEYDEEDGPWPAHACIAVNADSDGFVGAGDGGSSSNNNKLKRPRTLDVDNEDLDPGASKLHEVLWRFREQAAVWEREGRLDRGQEVVVVIALRDDSLAFVYGRNERLDGFVGTTSLIPSWTR
ncbi:Uu.00g029780.m01.CDS01 [Anthostomella pinea]|uniref:Uu.00g029780.m01.CDS01 n=1 Tax=Anthostomella pinea TaxID=933095 RepID=A0AAI8V973_9PEZI|nr:Uu.00g029780.m01.CDS01 [Anthostomella pinea]